MHAFRFLVPRSFQIPDDAQSRLFFADFFGTAFPCHATWNEGGDELHIEADEPSGYLHVPCRLPDGGERMMRTATIISRSEPYILPLELARGILHRMSNRYWEWKLAGIDMTERFGDALAASRIAFSRAVARQNDPTCRGEVSEQVFQLARAIMANMSLWMAEVVSDRHRNATTRDATYMIGRLPNGLISSRSAVAFAKSFEMAAIPTRWKSVQPEPDEISWTTIDQQLGWSRQRGLNTIVGPLLDLHPSEVPDWLYLWEDDAAGAVDAAVEWVEQVVEHCDGQISMWHAITGMAGPQSILADISARVDLTFRTVELLRARDPDVPLVVSFDQPFGEFLGEEHKVDPFAFATTLVDHGFAPDAIGLDLQFDVWPGGSVRRDPIDLFRRLDRWTDLELPLFLFLSAPSGRAEGPETASRVTHTQPSSESQSRLVTEIVPLLIAHPSVQGICWNEWTDAQPYRSPCCGMLSTNEEAKTSLETWRSFLIDATGRKK